MIPLELTKKRNWMYCEERNNAPANEKGVIVSWKDKSNWLTYNEKTKIFLLDNNYTVIDFDYCLDTDGNIYDWAKEFIAPFLGCGFYVEYSRSKRGLHVLAKGSLAGNVSIKMNQIHKKHKELNKKCGIEIFVSHAITLTGNVYKNNMPDKISGINDNFRLLYKHLIELKARNTSKKQSYNNEIDLFNFVKSSISLKDVFGYYNLSYMLGKNISCPLPNHKDAKPSFRIDSNIDLFYCYAGCGGGSVIDFVMKMENMNNLEAAKFLADKFNLEINVSDELKFNPKPNTADIFEKVNKQISENKKNEEEFPFSEGCFLDRSFKSGYYMVKQGFCKRYIYKHTNVIGEKEEMYADKIIIPVKIYPTKIFLVDNAEEIEFNNKLYLENDTFSSVAKFKTWISQLGKFLYFDGETKDLTGFQKYIALHKKMSKLETHIGVAKLGWAKDCTKFNPYSENQLFIKDDVQFDYLLECFNSDGSYEIWKEYIEKYNQNDIFRAIFNTSLTSPLIELIRRPPVWLHHYEKASTGKTPAAYAAASIWAKPGELHYTPNFSATKAGLEFMWNTLNNLPCILQDTQNLDKSVKDKINDVVYDMFNGTGKIRGTVTGKNHKLKTWKLSMITNGEQKILQGDEYEGASKRLIEITGLPFADIFEAKKARDVFQDNYGFYGEEYINTIKKYKDEIKKLCLQIEQKIYNDKNIETHIESIATLIVCDYLFNVYCLNKEKENAIKEAIDWGLRILKQLPYKDSVDKTIIAIEKINEFVLSNTFRFRPECPQGRVGWLKNGNVYFYPDEFKKLLMGWQIPVDRFYKEVKEKGITILDNNNNFKQVKHNNRNIRAIAFTHIDINNLIEEVDNYR